LLVLPEIGRQAQVVKVFWVVTPCAVKGYRRFWGSCCLHLQLVSYHTTQCHNPEDDDLKPNHRENLKTHKLRFWLDIFSL